MAEMIVFENFDFYIEGSELIIWILKDYNDFFKHRFMHKCIKWSHFMALRFSIYFGENKHQSPLFCLVLLSDKLVCAPRSLSTYDIIN
jgi:hypothetical protein